jgi:hypothetical protein
MKRSLVALCSLLLALAAVPAGAAVRALLDRTQIAPGETVQLTLVLDGQSGGQPDLTPLRTDFEILGESTRSNIQIINGHYSSRMELLLTLSPKHAGQLKIPALSWGPDQSQPLMLTVSAGSNGGQGAGAAASAPRVFITSEVQPSEPYLLAAVHLTVRIYAADPLNRPSLDLPTSNDVVVRQLGDDEVGTAEKNGASYYVITRRYLLFPQHSGTLSIAGPTLSAQLIASAPRDPRDPFSGLGGSPFSSLTTMRPIRVHGDPILLQVQPRPPVAANAPYWLPARAVTLEGDWHPGNLQAHVGDPITLDLKLRAVGLTAAQLPDLTSLLSIPPELKTYPEQPKLNDSDESDTVQASREQSLALIADQAGRYSIPALHLTWWDTGSNQAHEASLPARTLVILPAVGNPAPVAAAPAPSIVTAPAASSASSSGAPAAKSTPASAPSGGLPWRWISVGLTLLWLVTLGGWLLSRRKKKIVSAQLTEGLVSRTGEARAAFLEACRHDDAPAARRHLLAWAGAAWGKAPTGLNALGARLADPNVAALLRELDRACFAGGGWNGQALAGALAELPDRQTQASRRSSKLAPLYR